MLPWVANMSKRPRHSTIPQVSGPTVLIMAAGEGTRMRSSVPKMLHPVCGRPMVAWPVLAAREAGAERVCVIVSPARDLSSALPEGTETAVQTHSDGTGGAVRAALGVIQGSDTVIVMNGDHPLVTPEALEDTYRAHTDSGAAATVVSVEREDAESLGRVVRDANGDFERIVETKYPEGVPAEILAIHEVNTNTFAFDAEALADALGRITRRQLRPRVLHRRRAAAHARGRQARDRPQGRRHLGEHRRQQPRRACDRERDRPAADQRAPHA